jgi:DNA repair protein RadD
MRLRDYQIRDVERIRDAYRRGSQSVLYVAPTGSGKTCLFSYIGAEAAHKGNTVLVLVHRDELLRQAVGAFSKMNVPAGLIKQGQAQTSDCLQIASAQTLLKRLERWPHFDLAIFDEAHHLAPDNTFATVFEHFGTARKLLVTATPARLDGHGLEDFVDDMIVGPSIKNLCDQGYLARCATYAPSVIDMQGVHTRAGDFATNEVEARVDRRSIIGVATVHYRKHLGGAPAVIFCVTLKHAHHVAEQFQEAGYSAAVIEGRMSSGERQKLIDDLALGKLNVLASCQLLTEGVDCPPARGVIWLRPTQSLTLFLQGTGRGMRPKSDGGPCIVLDHAGNSLRFGLPEDERQWSLHGHHPHHDSDGEAPAKICPECDAVVPASCHTCPNCAYQFRSGSQFIEVDGELVDLKQHRRASTLNWLSSRWRPSAKGNPYVTYQGLTAVIYRTPHGSGWGWLLLRSFSSSDKRPNFHSAPNENAAKQQALNALLDAIEREAPASIQVNQ